MLFNIITFISIFVVCMLLVFMTILVEIKVKEILWTCVKMASIYGHYHRVEQLPINERYCTLLTKENSQV